MYHNIVYVGPFHIEWEQWEVCVRGVWKEEQEGRIIPIIISKKLKINVGNFIEINNYPHTHTKKYFWLS